MKKYQIKFLGKRFGPFTASAEVATDFLLSLGVGFEKKQEDFCVIKIRRKIKEAKVIPLAAGQDFPGNHDHPDGLFSREDLKELVKIKL